MKLKKDKWEKTLIGNVCKTTSGGTPLRTKSEYYNGNIPWIKSGELHNKYVTKAEESITQLGVENSSAKIFPINTVLVAIYGVTSGTTAILKTEAATNQAVCGIIPKKNLLNYEYLYNVLTYKKEEIFKKRVGTYQMNVSQEIIRNTEILLPPLEEQKQIAGLFQSIEKAMEEVEGEEKRMKELQKNLVNGLMNKEPVFGDLFYVKGEKYFAPTKFGDIADCDKKYPEHEKEVERFIGLEYLEADSFQLQGFGLVADGTTFTKRFAKGDVLFGKRRAYLKKVAVADFDGVCSGDILVIRAKPKKMLQGLLPYYISSEAFIQHAVSTSAGSLSPRTKWKDLAELEVSIPDFKIQEKILEVLLQFEKTIGLLKGQRKVLKDLKGKLLGEILG